MDPERALGAVLVGAAAAVSFMAGAAWARRPRAPRPPAEGAPALPPPTTDRDRARACLEAESAERQRIAAHLHDELQPLIAAARLQLELPGGGAEASAALGEAGALVRGLAHELGDPDVELGVEAGLARVCAAARARLPLAVELRLPPQPAPPVSPLTHSLCLMCVRELLHNAHRHARAGRVEVRVEVGQRWLLVGVEDDGPGFGDGGGAGPGLGLRSMRRRLDAIGGELDLGAGASGGARVTLCLPLGAGPRPAPDTHPHALR